MSTRMRIFLAVVLGVVAPVLLAPSADAACPFRKSCTKRLFRCFRPKGTCTRETAGAITKACWANGVSITQESGTGGTITVLGKKGRPCASGTFESGPNGEFQVAWTRGEKTYRLTLVAAGTRRFTCPSGDVEDYSDADFASGETCGHIPSVTGMAAAACASGSCP